MFKRITKVKSTTDHEPIIYADKTAVQQNQWVAPELIFLDSADTFGKSVVNPGEGATNGPS